MQVPHPSIGKISEMGYVTFSLVPRPSSRTVDPFRGAGPGEEGLAWVQGYVTFALQEVLLRANFFLGPTFDLENFPTSGVKGRVLP